MVDARSLPSRHSTHEDGFYTSTTNTIISEPPQVLIQIPVLRFTKVRPTQPCRLTYIGNYPTHQLLPFEDGRISSTAPQISLNLAIMNKSRFVFLCCCVRGSITSPINNNNDLPRFNHAPLRHSSIHLSDPFSFASTGVAFSSFLLLPG